MIVLPGFRINLWRSELRVRGPKPPPFPRTYAVFLLSEPGLARCHGRRSLELVPLAIEFKDNVFAQSEELVDDGLFFA